MDEAKKVGGGTVRDFKDLKIYKTGRELAADIYQLTKIQPFSRDYSLVDQMRRASVSILSNIAEGFERGTNKEFITFLFIAKASCGEIRAQLDIALDQKYIEEKTYKELSEKCKYIGAMTNKLILYLKSSRFTGPKHKKEQES
jgi:four helix bundle protein